MARNFEGKFAEHLCGIRDISASPCKASEEGTMTHASNHSRTELLQQERNWEFLEKVVMFSIS